MRTVSDLWPVCVTTSHEVITTVTASYDGTPTGTVPIISGSITFDDSAAEKRSLAITVPRRDGLTSWLPGDDPTHPLNIYGQQLTVQTGVRLPSGSAELVTAGTFLITSWALTDEDTIDVTGSDLARLIGDARFFGANVPQGGATYASEFARLAGGLLDTSVDSALTDRSITATFIWEEDRTAALSDLCDSWPARWMVADDGTLTALAAYGTVTSADVAWTVTDGVGGVLIDMGRGGERGVYNAVVVRGAAADNGQGGQPYGIAQVTDTTSPIVVGGPYGTVTRYYASDLLTDNDGCVAAAQSLLAAYSVSGRTAQVTMSPNPALELGDVVRATRGNDSMIGRVTAMSVPLTPGDGAMSMTISNATPDEEA